ncbi:MAG: DUF1285 domain-containing protein [Sphingomonadales bacterium]
MTQSTDATKCGEAGDDASLGRLESLIEQARGASYPPVEKWSPEVERDIGMKIDVSGQWFYQGSPIQRAALVKLFSSVLRREEDGRYALVTPVEKIWLDVEDAPLLAVEMAMQGAGRDQVIIMRTNVNDQVIIDVDHPLWVETGKENDTPRPYIRVRGHIDALVTRALYYELVERAVNKDNPNVFGVWSSGRFFELGRL